LRIAPETLRLLKEHDWPGNIRELANVIEHATILCDQPPILPEHLPRRFHRRAPSATADASLPVMPLRELELLAIREALVRNGGNKPKAAQELGVSLKTLYNKLGQIDAEK